MKEVRRRPVKEQEGRLGEGENRDRSVDLQDGAPSLERRMRRKPARNAFSGAYQIIHHILWQYLWLGG
jgi:hypothetical protein